MKLPQSWDQESGASDRLAAHLQEVVRERDPYGAPVGHAYVQAYVTQQLAGYGVVTAHEFGHLGRTHQNLVLDLPGQTDRGLVLVGAHYDAVPGSPGADDNGSALAVLLELARAFSTTPARRLIRLIAFDLEESDRAGSRAYAEDEHIGRGAAMLQACESQGTVGFARNRDRILPLSSTVMKAQPAGSGPDANGGSREVKLGLLGRGR